MTTYTGRQTVDNGFYLNMKTFSLATMSQPGALPGTELETYRRVPMLAMLVAAPVLGLLFVMFLPLLGFFMALHLVGSKVVHMVTGASTEGVRVLRPSWAPALAFLHRSKPADTTKADAAKTDTTTPDAWKDDVEKQLNDNDRNAQ